MLVAVMVLAGVGLGISGCGGGSTPTNCTGPACNGGGGTTGNYTVTVIGADTTTGSITANTTFNLTVVVQ
jgi:hypothetical protein